MDIESLGREAIQRIKSEWGLPKKGFVAGGSIANIIWELVSGNKAVINDIDVFVLEKKLDINEDNEEIESLFKYEEKDIQYYEDYTGMCFRSYTKDFYSITESKREDIFNTITYQSSDTSPDIILKSFDINATRVGYSIEHDKIYWCDDFEEFLKTGKLKVSNLMTPSHTAVRLAKKSNDLGIELDKFEFQLIQHALMYQFNDIIKLRFKERYHQMYIDNKELIEKYFFITRDEEMEKYVLQKFKKETKLYTLASIESKGKNEFDIFARVKFTPFNDENLNHIFLSDIFLFYMRNIYFDKEKVELWTKLKFFFRDPNYFDREVDIKDIELLERLAKYAPNSVDNLRGLKLSEQVELVNRLFDTYKHDPIIAISILEKTKMDKDVKLDEQTALLLELSVRKEIVNDTRGKVKNIVKEIKEKDSLNDDNFWDLLDL